MNQTAYHISKIYGPSFMLRLCHRHPRKEDEGKERERNKRKRKGQERKAEEKKNDKRK